jgi:hypothetical protein
MRAVEAFELSRESTEQSVLIDHDGMSAEQMVSSRMMVSIRYRSSPLKA